MSPRELAGICLLEGVVGIVHEGHYALLFETSTPWERIRYVVKPKLPMGLRLFYKYNDNLLSGTVVSYASKWTNFRIKWGLHRWVNL